MTARGAAGNLSRMETSTRYIGWCPVCQRQIKVQDGLLVHHGYKRPGIGAIVGDCFGVNMPPHELSATTAQSYLNEVIEPGIRATERALVYLGPPGEPEWLQFEQFDREKRQYVPVKKYRSEVSDYDWEQRLRLVRMQEANRLEYLQGEARRLENLVATWQPHPLTTTEEEIARAIETRAERTRRKEVEREQRMAEALVSLQQRIDSAVRNKRPETLQNLFREGHNKLVTLSGYKLEHEDVLRLVDRDHVWRAFGLIQPDGSYLLNWRDVQKAFEPWTPWGGREPAPFPAELGGGKVKLRR